MKITGLILVLSVLGGFVYYKETKVESKPKVVGVIQPEKQIEQPLEIEEVAVKPPAPPEEFQPVEVKVVRQEDISVDPITLPTIKKLNPPVKEIKPVEDKKLQQGLKKIEELDAQFAKQEKIRDSINKDISTIKFDLAEIEKRYKERIRKEKLRNDPRFRNKTIDSESLHNIDRDFNFKSKELDKAYANLDRCEREMDRIISDLKNLK